MACLHHAFEKALEWEMIESSPFKRGRSLLTKENNKRTRFLNEEEISALLNECPKHLKSIVVCALNSGMMRGEILSLQWSQIRNGLIYLSKTKTNEPRQIPIDDTLEALFSDLRKAQGPGAQYVFPFTKGEHKLKSEEPVRERKGPAPLPDVVQNVRCRAS